MGTPIYPKSLLNRSKMVQNDTSNSRLETKIFSAALGAFFCTLIVTPLDVIKTRLQAKTAIFCKNGKGHCFDCTKPLFFNRLFRHYPFVNKKSRISSLNSINNPINNPINSPTNSPTNSPINSPIKTISFIVRHEGVLSFWNGLRPALLFAVPSAVSYLNLYDYLRTTRITSFSGDWASPM